MILVNGLRRGRMALGGILVLAIAALIPLAPTRAAETPVKQRPVQIKNEIIQTSFGDIAVAVSEGRGPNVLFIHGNSSEKEIFQKQLTSPLGRKYHMVAMDLPGHGQSSNAIDPARGYNIPGYAQAALEVMDKLHMKTATVVGWSLGGHIGIDMLPRRPDLKGLLIMGTPPIGKTQDALSQGFKPSPHMGLTGKEVFTEEEALDYAKATAGAGGPVDPFVVDGVKRTDGRARRMMIEAFGAGIGDDQRKIVETSKVPLAVVDGAEDEFVNVAYLSQPAYANLWRRKVQIIPGAGHAPFWQKPAEFNRLLASFLADVNGKGK
jgi:pimeloyl-ACP methyl ester carboxylesterase